MHSIGLDIIEISRIEQALIRFGVRFLQRVYTPVEIAFCRNRPPELAARFAGKEAVMKALGTGVRGVGWREIEITLDDLGKPLVQLHGRARVRSQVIGLDVLSISLSHSREYALASVMGTLE